MDKQTQLSSKFCESLGMSVILCRDGNADGFRCLSSHLCGGGQCKDSGAQTTSVTDASAAMS